MPGTEFDGYPLQLARDSDILTIGKLSVPGSGFDGQPSGRPLVPLAVKMIAN